MQLECPNCTAVYDVPANLLGASPRRVRCARCAREWTYDPAAQPGPAAQLGVPTAAAPSPNVAVPPAPIESAGSPASLAEIDELERILADASLGPAQDDGVGRPAGGSAAFAGAGPTITIEPFHSRRDGTRHDGTRHDGTRRDGRAVTSAPPSRLSPFVIGTAWLVTIVLLGSLAAAAITLRGDVMRAWPASERAYRAIGLR